MSVYVILSLQNVIRRSFFLYYLISLIYTVLVEVLFRMPHHRDPKNIREAGIDIGSPFSSCRRWPPCFSIIRSES